MRDMSWNVSEFRVGCCVCDCISGQIYYRINLVVCVNCRMIRKWFYSQFVCWLILLFNIHDCCRSVIRAPFDMRGELLLTVFAEILGKNICIMHITNNSHTVHGRSCSYFIPTLLAVGCLSFCRLFPRTKVISELHVILQFEAFVFCVWDCYS